MRDFSWLGWLTGFKLENFPENGGFSKNTCFVGNGFVRV